ncbi:alpha/beta fold hydrolase [Solihabitans fulvus]|uniref:Alpha/beta fold hydrolase n=1 Tax=Solihabitans fulvus TaxID=1892852 RepID=A0A5B2WSQ2_9PSEU|nr:alpha/beta fold hydrolase [Solihabitans fulvus]KAA2253860.1 alpha/beta fold hydrolase [Solihabitans fulvus]
MSGIYRSEEGARLLRERYLRGLEYWPVDSEQVRVPTAEGETFVIVSGPVDAPPLVLLHGSGSNSAQWVDRVAGLAERFRVYAVDVIGEPGLSAPSRPPFESDRYAVWLGAVLDFFGLDRVSVLAMSLGGWLALDFATRSPGRVARLVLVCPTGVGRQKKGFLLKAMVLGLLGGWGRRATVRGVLGPAVSTLGPAAEAMVVEQVLLVSRNLRYRSGDLPVFGDDALRRLTMPVAVFVGQLDVMLDSAVTKRRFEAVVPHAVVRMLPGVGHFVPAQAAAELEFLTGADRVG